MLATVLCGCSTFTVKPGSDPVVVYAEASAETAFDVFNSFLKWESQNESALLKVSPQIHATANEIRRNGVGWIKELRTATKAYKESRNGPTRTKLEQAQQFLDMAIQEVRQRLAEGKTI